MEGRSDLDGIHDRAFATMLNYVATVEGPATKRPGFRFIKEAALASTWLSRFVFNTKQSYVLEWGDQRVRFFTNGGRIEIAGEPYELVVPYSASEAPRISSKQSNDRLYLAHGSHFPGMITRTAAEQFEFGEIPLKDGPFKDFNTEKDQTITWSGSGVVGGSATIAATFPLFEPGHVGSHFMFEVKDFKSIPAWEAGQKATTMVVNTTKRRSDGKVYLCRGTKGGGSSQPYTGSIEPTHNEGSEWDGSGDIVPGTTDDKSGVLWEYQYDRFGIGKIVSVTSETTAVVEVTRALPELSDPTYRWAHSCFSDVEGYPQLVGVWAGRLIFVKGVDLIASVVGDYWNMAPIDKSGIFAPDQAFRLELSINDPPTWLHADKEFLLLGNASEEVVVAQDQPGRRDLGDQPQRATAIRLRLGRLLAASDRHRRDLPPARRQEDPRGGLQLRARPLCELEYHDLRAPHHPVAGQVAGMAARARGAALGRPWRRHADRSPAQPRSGGEGLLEARARARHRSRAASRSRRPTAPRTSCGSSASSTALKGMLQLGDFWDEDAGLDMADAFFVDWGVSYDGPPKQNFTTGLSHLEGKQVRVLADGAEYQQSDRFRRLDLPPCTGEQGSHRARLCRPVEAPPGRGARHADAPRLAQAARASCSPA
jgi:hypothetical protein